MTTSHDKRFVGLLLMIGLSVLFFVYLVQHNWELHARFNLFLHGHVLCQLKSSEQFTKPPLAITTGFVSKYVYAHGEYIGYLNRYGGFFSTENIASQDQASSGTVTLDAVLLCLEWALIVILVSIFLYLLQGIRSSKTI